MTSKTEKKQIDQKTTPADLRTLPAQKLKEVAGGRGYLTFTLRDVIIGGY